MGHNLGFIIGIIAMLLCLSLSGCLEQNNQNKNHQNNNTSGTNTNGDQPHNTTQNLFLGNWRVIDATPDYATWSFYTNHSAKNYLIQESEGEQFISNNWFEYTNDTTTLCFSTNPSPESPDYFSICYLYNFSENATRLTLTSNGIVIIDLEKM